MICKLAIALIAGTFLVSIIPSSFAETVFDENFDSALTGWSESLCVLTAPLEQVCSIGQDTELLDFPNDMPNSPPFWGFVQIDDPRAGPDLGPIEVRYSKSFTIINEDDYQVRAWLGIKDCIGCMVSTSLYIDGNLVFEKIGPDILIDPIGVHSSLEQTLIHITSGVHEIEIAMSSTGAAGGMFRASFDDIKIIRDTDSDGDGVSDIIDNCIDDFNPGQEDIDVDGLGDSCDNLHLILNDIEISGTFTILPGQSLTVTPGVLLGISGEVNNNSDETIDNFGHITIFLGTINNAGTINNHPGGEITNQGGDIHNSGTITNMRGAALANLGELNNNSGGIIINQANAFLLNAFNGKINNNEGGMIIGEPNTIFFNINSAEFRNNAGGTIILNGPGGGFLNRNSNTNMINEGQFTINDGVFLNSNSAKLTNTGTITNNADALLINFLSAMIANDAGGIIQNNAGGILVNTGSGIIDNNSGGTISNFGAITNSVGAMFNNNDGGIINNHSYVFFNSPESFVSNNLGANFNNNSGGFLFNLGSFTNRGIITNDGNANLFNIGGGNLINSFGSRIDNNNLGLGLNGAGSTLNNNVGGIINNDNGGNWFNECDGIVINDGFLFGTIVDLPCA